MISPSTHNTGVTPVAGSTAGTNTAASAEGDGIFQLLFGQLTQLMGETGANGLQVSDQKLMEIEPLEADLADDKLLALVPVADAPVHGQPEQAAWLPVSPTVTLLNQSAPVTAEVELSVDLLSDTTSLPDNTRTVNVDVQTHSVATSSPAGEAAVPLKRLAEIREHLDAGRVVLRPNPANASVNATETVDAGMTAATTQLPGSGWLAGGLNSLSDTPQTADSPAVSGDAPIRPMTETTTARTRFGQPAVADATITTSARLNASRLSTLRGGESVQFNPGAVALSGSDTTAVNLQDGEEAMMVAQTADPIISARQAAVVSRQAFSGNLTNAEATDKTTLSEAQASEEAGVDAIAELNVHDQSESGADQKQSKDNHQALPQSQSSTVAVANTARNANTAWQNAVFEVGAGQNASPVTTARAAESAPIDPTLLSTDGSPLTGNARLDPTPLPAATLSLREANWDKGLGANVAFMLREDIKTASIRVNPEELGALDIQLESENEKLTVSITAAHSVTRDTLEASLPRLREQFASLGFERVDVNVRDQAQDNGQGESLLAGDERKQQSTHAGHNAAYASENGEASVRAVRVDALLDTYA